MEVVIGDVEDSLAQAERHVREAEGRVAHQVATIEVLDRGNHPAAAALARKMLATLRHSLELARGQFAWSARRADWRPS